MGIEQLRDYWWVIVAIGSLLMVWPYRNKIKLLNPLTKSKELTPAERFEALYSLRSWCEKAKHAEAVKALDGAVLSAIVCDECPHLVDVESQEYKKGDFERSI